MKVTALNTAIRKHDGAPKFHLRFYVGTDREVILSDVEMTKASLLEAIKTTFPDRNAETGLKLNAETGYLEREFLDDSAPATTVEEADDLEDLLG